MNTPWIHIEYAAGNYGNARIFGNFFKKSNFDVLIPTVEELARTKGSHGVFFVNDLVDEWAQLAAVFLEKHLAAKGLNGIKVRVLSGDVSRIQIPLTHTANLKNPRIGLIHLDAQTPFFKKLAGQSLTGLEITTHYPKILLGRAAAGGWKLENLGPGERYRFPSGRRRRLPTTRFLLRNPAPPKAEAIQDEKNRSLGRLTSDFSPPTRNLGKRITDAWHAFLVTLGIRGQ